MISLAITPSLGRSELEGTMGRLRGRKGRPHDVRREGIPCTLLSLLGRDDGLAARVAAAQQGPQGPRGLLSPSLSPVVDPQREGGAEPRGGRQADRPVRAGGSGHPHQRDEDEVPRQGREGLSGSFMDRRSERREAGGQPALVPPEEGDSQMVAAEGGDDA